MAKPAMLAQEGGDLADLSWWTGDIDWTIEQKANGERMMVEFIDALTFKVLNRNGDAAGFHIPRPVIRAMAAFAGLAAQRFVLDGELVGATWWVFDIAEGGAVVPPGTEWHKRRAVLERMFELAGPGPEIQLLPTARTPSQKQALIERVVEIRGEGFIGKHVASKYVHGEPRSDQWRKVKLTSTIDCVITEVARPHPRTGERKDNYEVVVYEYQADGPVIEHEIGTVAWNDKRTRGRCKAGEVLEVVYLYTDTNGRLVQPRILRRRTDKSPAACTVDQLRPPTDKTVITY